MEIKFSSKLTGLLLCGLVTFASSLDAATKKKEDSRKKESRRYVGGKKKQDTKAKKSTAKKTERKHFWSGSKATTQGAQKQATTKGRTYRSGHRTSHTRDLPSKDTSKPKMKTGSKQAPKATASKASKGKRTTGKPAGKRTSTSKGTSSRKGTQAKKGSRKPAPKNDD